MLSLILIFILSSSPITLGQDPASSSPTITQCAPRLLPLAPCGPFVQGNSASPPQPCCDNLKQLYSQQPHCLCLLLNDTTLSSFPINSSLALQLPVLCSLQVDISVCSQGVAGSPGSQVSLGSTNNSSAVNSTMAASPAVQTAPIPSNVIGLGNKSGSIILKTDGEYIVVLVATLVTLLIELLF
ncbi:hypothetical protein UlMin_008544 [Ulmus minor]